MTKAENREFYRKLRRTSLPIVLQSLMLALVAAADALMLGQVSEEHMAAVSLATQVQFVQNMFLTAVTAAGSILGAQYWGKGDKETLRRLFNLMLCVNGLVSLVFFGACVFLPELLMLIFTGEEALIRIGASYLSIAGWSYLLTGVSQCCLAIMKVTDHVRPGAFISSSAVVLNVLLNAVFIFGLFGTPAMRAEGAAYATMAARAIELLLCVLFNCGKDRLRPALKQFFRIDRRLLGDFFKQCLPLTGSSLLWGVGFTSYTAIIGHLGVDAAAANSVSAVVRDLTCCACNGVGGAAAIMVGNELGKGDLALGKAYGVKLTKLSFVIGFASTGLVLAVTPIVLHTVVLTDNARDILLGMMLIMSFYMIGRCVNTVTINGVLAGGGDTVFDLYSLAIVMWGVAIPLALLGAFVFKWHVLAVYACTCLDEVGKIPWVMYRVSRFKWVRNLTRNR